MTTHSPDPAAYVEENRPTRVKVIDGLMANTEGYIANRGETLSWVIIEDSKKGLTPHLHVNSNLEEIDVREDIKRWLIT